MMTLSGIRTVTGRLIALACLSCSIVLPLTAAADDMAAFATGGYASGLRTMELMHKIDTNGDGMVSREEWLAFQEKVFTMLDGKKAGLIDAKEFVGGGRKEMASFATGGYARGLQTHAMMTRIDADGDGTISHDEFVNYQLKIFDMMSTSAVQKDMLSQSDWIATAGKAAR